MNFYAERLERAFVQLVVRKAGNTEESLRSFAMQVWPDKEGKRAQEKMKLLTEGYQGKRAGRQQRLVFGDAQRMAHVLQTPLCYLVMLAEENIKREDQGLEPY